MPIGRLFAEVLTVANTAVAGPPGGNQSLVGETARPAEAFGSDHGRVLLPALVRMKVFELGRNGPPTGPLETKPVIGEIRKSSGRSKASRTPVVVELPGDVALKPMPRLAKAAQRLVWLAPPVSTSSA